MAAKEGEGMGDLPWQASRWLFVVRLALNPSLRWA